MRPWIDLCDQTQDQRHNHKQMDRQRQDDGQEILAKTCKQHCPAKVDRRQHQTKNTQRSKHHHPLGNTDHHVIDCLDSANQRTHLILRQAGHRYGK